MHIFYKKNSKVELHSSKFFCWWLSSNSSIFSCKMSMTFESRQDILYLEPKEKDIKEEKPEEKDKTNFNWKKSQKLFFSSCPNYIFAVYSLIFPNLQIFLKQHLHIQIDLKD